MMDLMYFNRVEGSEQLQAEFIKIVQEKFPDVVLADAWDEIKGYRQSVTLPDEKSDDYHAWLFGVGFFEMSINYQMMKLSPDKHDKIKELIELAKKQYPKAFKRM